jgi:p-hydroxybenzoate 3-monooxygenase
VFVDLSAARERDGGEVYYSVSDTEVLDQATDTPKIRFTDSDGARKEIHVEILVGADGSGGSTSGAPLPQLCL